MFIVLSTQADWDVEKVEISHSPLQDCCYDVMIIIVIVIIFIVIIVIIIVIIMIILIVSGASLILILFYNFVTNSISIMKSVRTSILMCKCRAPRCW